MLSLHGISINSIPVICSYFQSTFTAQCLAHLEHFSSLVVDFLQWTFLSIKAVDSVVQAWPSFTKRDIDLKLLNWTDTTDQPSKHFKNI